MTLRPVLFRIVLCTAVALALWGWIAHEAPTGNAPEAGNRPALTLQRELPTEVGEASSFPGIGPVALENPAAEAGSVDGSAQAPPAERSGADEETREADSDPQNRRVVSETLNVDALRAGDKSARRLYKAFLARIEKEGSVPLIIGFSAPVAPESSLVDPGEVDQQRQMLTAVQDIVLTDLAGVATDNVKRFETIPYLALTVDAEGLTALVDSDPVITIEEDVAVPAALLDSVPLIGATPLHSSPHGYDGTGFTVAILDTGVDKSHPFLDGGKVVSEACYSTNRAADHATSTCPGGVAESTAAGSGVACDIPDCDHGTWVAGIAAGKDGTGATGGTLQGVAPGASIIAIQVFSKLSAKSLRCIVSGKEECFASYVSDQIKGLERVYALRNTYKIAAVNLSLGGGKYASPCDFSARKATIDNLRAAGIATVTTSGNRGYDGAASAPGCISSAITVGASDKRDQLWWLSNHASFVDMIAPGVAIQSSVLDGAYEAGTGTSAAAPHVTGCFALYRDKYPSASVTTIEAALEESAPVSLSRGGISKPRIDCHAAVLAPIAKTPLSPRGATTDSTPTYSWKALAAATSYQLWVNRGASPVRRTWYTAAQAGCAAGTGTCSVTPGVVLQRAAYTWRVKPRTLEGLGRWSHRINFSVEGPPGQATLTSPHDTKTGATPTYSWQAMAAATSYTLQVDRGASRVHSASYTTAQAGCTAGRGTCSITPSTALQLGAHSWRIQTANRHGAGRWSERAEFTVAALPRAAILISPRGQIFDTTPTYRWNAVATATSYLLWKGDSVIGIWYTAEQAGCAGSVGICSITPSRTLELAPQSWQIQARNAHGRGPWSKKLYFQVGTVPEAPTVISPQGTTTNNRPRYSWNAVATALFYGLEVRRGSDIVLDTSYSLTSYSLQGARCAAGTGTCLVVPRWPKILFAGAHSVRVRAWNLNGFSPWSESLHFTVINRPPGKATLISPQGTTADTTPTYSWNAVATATRYYLRVGRGSNQVIGTWYTATQAGCAAGTGTCRITPSTALQRYYHTWWIDTWNRSGKGPRSSLVSFDVDDAPGATTLISPRGMTTDTTPTYRWNAVATATAYYLGVNRGSNKVIGTWYTAAQTGCAARTGTCSLTPSTALQSGDHTWWIQTKNLGGEGPESVRLRFAVVSPPVASPPVAATLIAPQGTTTDTTPTYSWNAVAAATHYYLWVSHESSQVIGAWYTAAQAECATGTGTCSITPSTTLQPGVHGWWIQTWGSEGRGPWSARTDFAVGAGFPEAAVPITPVGATTDTTPTYSWNALPSVTHYYLWVGHSSGRVIGTWYTAAQAGCAEGTGTCRVTPSTALQSGAYAWWIQTWNAEGRGPWSARSDFTVGTDGGS